MRRVFIVLLAVVVISGLIFSGCAGPAPAPKTTPTPTPQPSPKVELITWKAVSFQPSNAGSTKNFQMYINTVNERGKGKIEIKYLGGPEVSSRENVPVAIKNGTIDLTYTPFTFYGGVVPIGHSMMLTEITAKEERKRGLWDYIRDLHAEAGYYWLGRGHSDNSGDLVWNSTKKITSLKDLAGMKAGSGSTFAKPLTEALGATFVQVQTADTYTALERGVIDAYTGGASGQVAASAHKICKYFIDRQVYGANMSMFTAMNRWKSLPKELQDLLQNTVYDIEDAVNKNWRELADADVKKFIEAGETPVKLSPDEEEQWVKIALKSAAESALKDFPNTAPKILELLKK